MMVRTATTLTRMGKVPLSAGKPGVRGCNGCGLGQDMVATGPGTEYLWLQAPSDGAGVPWWQSILGTAERTLASRYGVPQIPPGTTIQTPGGVLTRQTPGYPTPYGGLTAQVSSGGWVLAAAAVIGLVAIMAMRKH